MSGFELIPSGAAQMQAYFALPSKPNGCGIVLGSSVVGTGLRPEGGRGRLCRAGYAVVAPTSFGGWNRSAPWNTTSRNSMRS